MSSKLSRCSSSILIIVSQYLNCLFNYNNLTIILITMIGREVKQRWKLTLKLGSLVQETLVKKNKRAGGAYKWTKVRNQAGGTQFCVRHWKSMAGDGGGHVVVVVVW